MNKILITAFLLATCMGVAAFYKQPKPSKSIRLKQLTSTIKNDTGAVIDVIIDNGEREREFAIHFTAWPDSLVLSGTFSAWYYNYSKTYTAIIPLN